MTSMRRMTQGEHAVTTIISFAPATKEGAAKRTSQRCKGVVAIIPGDLPCVQRALRTRRISSRIRQIAPMVMAVSAMLKAGKCP